MSKTVDFLNNSKVFYHASVDRKEARVRPINSVIAYKEKIYFETSNKKEMYQQMLKNPSISVSGMVGSKWIRITGNAVMDESEDAKDVFFSEIPSLKSVYTREELVPYYITDMKSIVYGFGTEPVELED